MKNFDFDIDTSEIIFSNNFISYVANERLQGEKQYHFKNYFLETPRTHVKMRLKSASQKLNFESFALNCRYKCPRMFPHTYA